MKSRVFSQLLSQMEGSFFAGGGCFSVVISRGLRRRLLFGFARTRRPGLVGAFYDLRAFALSSFGNTKIHFRFLVLGH